MAISAKETQDIIQQIARFSSRGEITPYQLDPRESGMATGPRYRQRSLLRPDAKLDYVRPSQDSREELNKLDDDIYKFIYLRREQFGRRQDLLSHQFIWDVEGKLRSHAPEYEVGAYLGLLRMAADLDQTGQTHVTSSEKNTFHAFGRRATVGRGEGEIFDASLINRYQALSQSQNPQSQRALADLFRLVARAARLPLIGNMQEASSAGIGVLLRVIELAGDFNSDSRGGKGGAFQLGPMDVFLAARAVLANRSVTNPTLTLLTDLVLDEGGLYHEDLLNWLRDIASTSSDHTLLIPDSLSRQSYRLGSQNLTALEMVLAGGYRLAKDGRNRSDLMAGISTLGDALLHQVQIQDTHKDLQIQKILHNFNRLLREERRSAMRINEDRQVERAEASNLRPVIAEGAVEFQTADYGPYLTEWDDLVDGIRRRLTSKSPAFRNLVAQLAVVRSLDTCMLYGLTPPGSRCVSRLARLFQDEETRERLQIRSEDWERLEDKLAGGQAGLFSSLEALLGALYGFEPVLHSTRFRLADRVKDHLNGSIAHSDSAATVYLERDSTRQAGAGREYSNGDEGDGLDVALLRVVAEILLLQDVAQSNGSDEVDDPYGKFLAYLLIYREQMGRTPFNDPATLVRRLNPLPPVWEDSLQAHYLAIQQKHAQRHLIPSPTHISLPSGWRRGFELGYMSEIKTLFDEALPEDLHQKLLDHITGRQVFLDKASQRLAEIKLRLARERMDSILGG